MAVTTDNHFFVDNDGLIHETPVVEAARRLEATFSEVDIAALEAELMLERTHRLLAGDRDAHWAQFGLTGSRFILLRLLHGLPSQKLTMGEIAVRMNLGPNNVTQLVDALTERGLVERQAGEYDKRVVYAALTQEGSDLFSLVMPQNARRIAKAWSPLNAREKRVLSHLLAKVRMHMLSSEALLEVDHSSDSPD
jgi:MarR family transcriptional regulator, 2-MHQ and catechol-resistance regulon repressor